MSSPPADDLRAVPAVRFGIAVAVLFTGTAVCERLGLHPVASTVVLTAVAMGAASRLPLRYAVATGLVAWALLTGFLLNAGGQLSFGRDDLLRAGVLVLAATATQVARRGARHLTHPRPAPVGHWVPEPRVTRH